MRTLALVLLAAFGGDRLPVPARASAAKASPEVARDELSALLLALRGPDAVERVAAVRGLGERDLAGDARGWRARERGLLVALGDDDPEVRLAVLEALGSCGDRRARPRLLRWALDSPFAALRTAAATSLASVDADWAFDALEKRLAATDGARACRALAVVLRAAPDRQGWSRPRELDRALRARDPQHAAAARDLEGALAGEPPSAESSPAPPDELPRTVAERRAWAVDVAGLTWAELRAIPARDWANANAAQRAVWSALTDRIPRPTRDELEPERPRPPRDDRRP